MGFQIVTQELDIKPQVTFMRKLVGKPTPEWNINQRENGKRYQGNKINGCFGQ